MITCSKCGSKVGVTGPCKTCAKQKGVYAIYLNNGRDDNCVLLTDGAWTSQDNCFRREHGIVWHKPVLIANFTKARRVAREHGGIARKYSGPTEPRERAA